jgi:hypothetical protein
MAEMTNSAGFPGDYNVENKAIFKGFSAICHGFISRVSPVRVRPSLFFVAKELGYRLLKAELINCPV